MIIGRPIDQLAVGDSAELSRHMKASDIAEFVRLVGDINPVHSDAMLMGRTTFQEPIVPGMWTAALIFTVIGNRLPGPGSIYEAHDLKFLKPVKVGDMITARVEVVELLSERKRVRLKTTCVNQRGELVLSGDAWVLPPRSPVAIP